ncbi:MAG TPA: thiamine phosphate synthase [Polyangiaceae bacterium]|nr:thiamine phosphate synthase [Polyangiaceae bacterium]
MRGLYPIVDVDSLRELGSQSFGPGTHAVLAFAERVLAARPPLLQLRAKHAGTRDTLELLRALRPLCSAFGARLVANDRPDLAVLAQCDGVHIGQEDLPLPLVRLLAPGLLVGVSTHTLEQLLAALAEKPDYVAFGPVFGTASKERADPSVGLALLAQAHAAAHSAGIPLVAIGGINLERAPRVAEHSELAAVIAALQPTRGSLDGVSEAAQALHTALLAGRAAV